LFVKLCGTPFVRAIGINHNGKAEYLLLTLADLRRLIAAMNPLYSAKVLVRRLFLVLVLLGSTAVWAGPFAPADTPRQYHRARVMDVTHSKLDIRVDLKKGTVSGSSTITFKLLRAVRRVTFDAAEMTIKGVSIGDKAIGFTQRDALIEAELPSNVVVNVPTSVRIEYEAKPRRGLYFVRPDAGYSNRPWQAWSQGEAELNRYWYPGYDYPDDRFTSEMLVTVRKPFLALSNGALLGVRDAEKGWHTYHYKESVPHVNYLVSLIAGNYVKYDLPSSRVPLEVYLPPGKKETLNRVFGKTDHIIRFFEDYIGVPYPYEKYAQSVVTDFLFGGMENISATTLTDRTLHDERGHLDYQSEPLIAHELAHQWFGDLITCKSWAHLWLNEGFATYFEQMYLEAFEGKDAFDHDRFASLGWYKSSGYQRAMDEHAYVHPDDLFDGHTYIKGAWILHMLRVKLGDELFRKAVQHYTRKHQNGLVETDDLRKAFEEASGYQLQAFFEQWVKRPGHPELNISWRWDAVGKQVELHLKQQTNTPYDVRVPVRVSGSFGERTWLVHVNRKEHRPTLALPSRPLMVEMDPDGTLLADITVDKPLRERLFQLEHGQTARSRARAAQALEAFEGPSTERTVQALAVKLADESEFHVVRARVASALGDLDTPASTTALLAGLKAKDHRVRRAAAMALSRPTDNGSVHKALRRVFKTDRSNKTVGEALVSYVTSGGKNALSLLKQGLRRGSHMERIRKAALKGLVEVGTDAAFRVVLAETKWGKPTGSRSKAAEALGDFGEKKESLRTQARKRLETLLNDPRYWVVHSAIKGLQQLGDPAAIPALKEMRRRASSRRHTRQCDKAIRALRPTQTPTTGGAVREELDSLRARTDQLEDRLHTLEEKEK
jgi:aminopeptidase N